MKQVESFYSCGDKHLLFGQKKGRGYVSKKALFFNGEKSSKKKQPILMSLTSIQLGEDDKAKVFVYAGSTKGEIYCWSPVNQVLMRTVSLLGNRTSMSNR